MRRSRSGYPAPRWRAGTSPGGCTDLSGTAAGEDAGGRQARLSSPQTCLLLAILDASFHELVLWPFMT